MTDIIREFPHHFYQQFDADVQQEHPCAAYGGWQQGKININLSRTALVVMHAWDLGTPEQHPGEFRAVGEVPASYEICRTVFPDLLDAVRHSPMRVFHVAAGKYHRDYPGYHLTRKLAGPDPVMPVEVVELDETARHIQQFRKESVYVGKHNMDDVAKAFRVVKFPKEAEPADDEPIVENAHQLLAVCRAYNTNHLVYVGFYLNWCLLWSAGGMLEMSRHGLVCSTIREGVLALENRESAVGRLHREEALWRTSMAFGLVFDVEGFKHALKSAGPASPPVR